MATAELERRLAKHDVLLRALLTYLAMSDPQAFGSIVGGLVHAHGVPDDVARDITDMVEDIARTVR